MNWPVLLRDYQSALVGLLGFTGVIVTLVVNARLSRRQHERNLANERATLRGALLAELTVLRDSYENRLKMVAEGQRRAPGGGFTMPVYVMGDIYTNVTGKLGLLASEEATQVLVAYLFARELPDQVRDFKWGRQIPADQDTEHFIVVPPQAVEHVLTMHRIRLEAINRAIDVLKAKAEASRT